MNQQRAAQRERDAAPADRPEAAAEAAEAAEAGAITRAEDDFAKEADRMLSEGYEGAGLPRASLPPEEVVPLPLPLPLTLTLTLTLTFTLTLIRSCRC